jgi:hypothetical protein
VEASSNLFMPAGEEIYRTWKKTGRAQRINNYSMLALASPMLRRRREVYIQLTKQKRR